MAISSACLVKDGELLAAVEEERFRRIKHWAGFPSEAVRYCLDVADIGVDQLDHVAINRNAYSNLAHKLSYALLRRPSVSLLAARLRNRRSWGAIEPMLLSAFPGASFKGRIHQVQHHEAHLASAFYVSPYDQAVAVSLDGFGDFASTAWGIGRGSQLQIDGQVLFPHSLGMFYQALTQLLGFPNYGDEYKVMGLASYGTPRFLDEMRQIVQLQADGSFRLNLRFFRHHSENIVYEWDGWASECRQTLCAGPRGAAWAGKTEGPKDRAAALRPCPLNAGHVRNRGISPAEPPPQSLQGIHPDARWRVCLQLGRQRPNSAEHAFSRGLIQPACRRCRALSVQPNRCG